MVNQVIDLVKYMCEAENVPTAIEPGAASLEHRGDELHLLREIFRTYQVLMSAFARHTGMPASRFALMRVLATREGDVGITDLARKLGVNLAAVSRQIKELEGERIVRRRPDARDKRRSYVSLTPKGRKLFERIHERTHELERSLGEVLGTEEMTRAAVLLSDLRTFVENHR